MKAKNMDSVGLELSDDKLKIACLHRSTKHYKIVTKSILCIDEQAAKNIQALLTSLCKDAPGLQLAGQPTYISLAEGYVNRCNLSIEGDILRLKPYIIDAYIFARAIEASERPLAEIYIDYQIVEPQARDAEHTEVTIVWAEKSLLQPYFMALKPYNVNIKALELAEHSRRRFMAKTLPIYNDDKTAEFAICCGAALREWGAEGV